MPVRSSIFNFETVRGWIHPSRAFVLAIVLLCIGRLVLVSNPTLRPVMPIGDEDVWRRAAFLRSQADTGTLQAIVLGSSRTLSGFVPSRWNMRDRFRNSGVANLSVVSGGTDEFEAILDLASVEIPASLKVVVIDVEPWQFNTGFVGGRKNVKEYLAYKRMPFQPLGRIAFVLMWPISRRPISDWISARSDDFSEVYEYQKAGEELEALRDDSDAANADLHFGDQPQYSEAAEATLREMVSRFRAQGIRVVLVHPPVGLGYLEGIRQRPLRSAFFDHFRSRMQAMRSVGAEVVFWERASDLGLEGHPFVDYGHLSKRGAEAFTDRLYDHLFPSDPGQPAP